MRVYRYVTKDRYRLPVAQADSMGELAALIGRSYGTVRRAMEAVYRGQIKRKGRSLDANAYCWVLMDKLAAHYGATKEGIYQEEIRQIAGVSDIVCVQEKAADELMRRWSGRGLGWMAEKAPSKLQGCVNVTLWYGSSTYDTEQMSRLIARVVEDCREAGIETMTPQQLAALKSQWGEAQPIG